ncbi:MAG: protein translocase subunit SecD [Armatimonadota bacterium]|nr:protein translocase subunit SecD [Armatimonadota bacterium]
MRHKHILALVIVLVAASAFILGKQHVTVTENGKQITKPWHLKKGLDLAGGVRVVLRAETDKLPKGEKWSYKHLNGIVRVIRNRVDAFGVSEPLIQPKGIDQVVVEIPDIPNVDQAIEQLKSTARLEFRHLRWVQDKRHRGKYQMTIEQDEQGNDRYVFTDHDGKNVPVEKVLAESPVIVTGANLKPNAQANKMAQPPYEVYVAIEFDREGRKLFADFTRRNVGEYLAIVLNDQILSAPVVKVPILDGKATIEGGFRTIQEATRLAEFLNAGALPVPLEIVQHQRVEATLGQDSVDRSVLAGIIGLGLVVLFMFGYYLLPGVIADIALGIYAILTLALFKIIPVTLTLPGIAAYIISIGMAVDANILIFERLKEELRSGKTLRAAIDAGFARAFTSIFDSNVCTLITCLILGWLGTGPIRGFAIVLSLGVIVSMFTAIVVTRTILHLIVNTGFAQHPAWFGVRRQWVTGQTGRQVDVVGRMWTWYAISAAVILPGLFFIFGMHGLKPGIDFTGGSLMQLEFKHPVERASVEAALSDLGLRGSMVQKSKEDPKEFFIRTKNVSEEEFRTLQKRLKERVGEFEVLATERVGPTISRELTANAFKAIILASLGIVLYLSARFAIGGLAYGFRFGICAVIALLHDVGVIVGLFAIFGHFLHWEIDSLFVTALLTVIGFSNHDTIVIFDRIRENLRHRSKGETFDSLVNRSILQSFARSINTSLTVVLTLIALLLFGASNPSLKHFNVALLIGIITGTYSSIFNASQLLVLWQRIASKQPLSGVPSEQPRTATKPMDLKPLVEQTESDVHEEAATVTPVRKAQTATKTKTKKRKRRF